MFAEIVRALAFEGRLAIVGYVDGVLKSEFDLEAVHVEAAAHLRRLEQAEERRAARELRSRGFKADLLPLFAGADQADRRQVFALDELEAAKAFMESDAQVGKIVVRSWEGRELGDLLAFEVRTPAAQVIPLRENDSRFRPSCVPLCAGALPGGARRLRSALLAALVDEHRDRPSARVVDAGAGERIALLAAKSATGGENGSRALSHGFTVCWSEEATSIIRWPSVARVARDQICREAIVAGGALPGGGDADREDRRGGERARGQEPGAGADAGRALSFSLASDAWMRETSFAGAAW